MKKILFVLSVVATGAALSGCGSDGGGGSGFNYQQSIAVISRSAPENTEPLALEAFPGSDTPENTEPFVI